MTKFYEDPEKLGQGLHEVEISFKGSGTGKITTRWFRGKEAADAFLWNDHRDNVIKLQVMISGVVVEWNVLDGLRTGVVIEQELKDEQASESVQFDGSINHMSVQMAIRLVQRVPAMDEDTKSIFVEHLRTPKSFNSLSPEEILFRYGQLPEGQSLNFWQRAKVLLRRLLS